MRTGQTGSDPQHRRRAFTLIELMAASVLTVLLMLAVMRIVGSMARRQTLLAQQERQITGGWPAGMVDLIRADLLAAHGFEAGESRLTLTGSGGIDPVTLEASPQTVTVTYALETLGGRPWLVRRQVRRGSRSADNVWPELVCADVRSFELETLDQSEITKLLASAAGSQAGGKSLPGRMRLTMESTRPELGPMDQVIALR